jgi:large repetitive protein
VKPHSLFPLLLIAVSVLAISLTGASFASRTESGLTVSSSIDGSKLDSDMTLSGQVTWTASSSGTPNRIEFLIDGTSKWTDPAAPYQFGGDPAGKFDTTSLSNGQHKLTVKAYRDAGNNHATSKSVTVTISNGKNPPPPPPPPPPSSFVVTSSVANGATLTGSLTWTATPSGTTVSSVDFLIDGTVKWTENISPYVFNGDGNKLDTTTLSEGAHTLALQAHAPDGRTATTTSAVTVANGATPSSFEVTSTIAEGATLSGSLTWTATPSGTTVSSVDFLIDGTVKWTERIAPYQFNGDDPAGTLDTTTLDDGAHTLSVEAHATDGRTATASSSVTVKNGPATAPLFTVTSSIADGATISGSMVWTGTPSGDTVSKVEFMVDGTTKWTDQVAPYQFGGDPAGRFDTTALKNGQHMLRVTAYGTGGTSVAALSSVTISNVTNLPPASLGGIPRFGISSGYKILQRSDADEAFELDQIKAAGGGIVRTCSLPGNQAVVDKFVSAVLARGMEPLLVLWCTTGPISGSNAAAFAGAQAAKWKGRVRLYEFANEPDLNGWTGTTYGKALIPVYDAIKAADPNAIVIGGSLWKGAGGPVQFVTDMYNAGAKGHFDILSLHLYDDPVAAGTWNIWNMAFHMSPSVRSVMDAHGDSSIPIASTETGAPTTKYGEAGQATIVDHDFDALSDPRLAFILVYSMMDDVVTAQPGFGLLRPDLSRRPAWDVYRSRATGL